MYSIISALNASDIFVSADVTEFIDELSVKLLKVRASVRDGSLLYITELRRPDYQKYSYHWQKNDGELIMRWDNSPHWRNVGTFPHHKHERDRVLPSPRVSVYDVIKAMEEKLERQT